MRTEAPFTASDMEELDARLFSVADRVVSMREIHNGDISRNVIGLRHDVDDNTGSFDTALRMAEWEARRGYRSTYFLLHDSWYWADALERAPVFEEFGHEVGLHVNGIAEGLRQRRSPWAIVRQAVNELRGAGVTVTGCVAHGDPLCRVAGFVNDEMFTESRRDDYGDPDRLVTHDGWGFHLDPGPRSEFAFLYDPNWLSRADYLSDSGGRWSQPFDQVASRFGHGQLHMLVHPDWWAEAFSEVTV